MKPRRSWIVGLISVLLWPVVAPNLHWLHVGVMILTYIPLAVGQNLILGTSGQVAMGHAAFYGLGAYTTGILAINSSLPPMLVLAVAVTLCALLGLVVGLPAIRISGDYLFIVTMGVNLILLDFAYQLRDLTGGTSGLTGIPDPTILGAHLTSRRDYFYTAGVIAVVACVTMAMTINSRFGREIECVRDDPAAAQSVGIDVTRCRVSVFVLGAALAGMSGWLLAYYLSFVGPQNFNLQQSLLIFMMAIIGGLGSVGGSVVGAILIVGIPELFRPVQDYRLLVVGLAVLILMVIRPSGLVGRVNLQSLRRSA